LIAEWVFHTPIAVSVGLVLRLGYRCGPDRERATINCIAIHSMSQPLADSLLQSATLIYLAGGTDSPN
jgi:hypothetical protein